MNLDHEKTLFRYSCALENADFQTISAIMMQAADDPILKALLFDLEAAHQQALNLPRIRRSEVLTMPEILERANGRQESLIPPETRRQSMQCSQIGAMARVAGVVLLAGIVATVMLQVKSSETIALVQPTPTVDAVSLPETTLEAPSGHPVITAENADQLSEILQIGEGAVEDALWSPDGTTILLYGYGLWFHDGETLTETRRMDTGTYITDADFSPDGRSLVTADRLGDVRVYDIESGAERLHIDAFDQDNAFNVYVRFSPDGQQVAVTGYHGNDYVRIFDAQSGRERLFLHSWRLQRIRDLQFSPDGTVLAVAGLGIGTRSSLTGSPMYMVQLYDLATGMLYMGLAGPEEAIDTIAFSPDGNDVVGTSTNGKGYLWSVGRPVPNDIYNFSIRLSEHEWGPRQSTGPNIRMLNGATYAPDGDGIVLLSGDAVYLWQPSEEPLEAAFSVGELFEQLGYGVMQPARVQFDATGERVLITGPRGRIGLWNVADFDVPEFVGLVHGPNGIVSNLNFYDDDAFITGSTSSRVWLWNADSGEVAGQFDMPADETTADVVVHPASEAIAVSSDSLESHSLFLWYPHTDEFVPLERMHTPRFVSPYLAFDESGSRLYVNSSVQYSHRIAVWDVSEAELEEQNPSGPEMDWPSQFFLLLQDDGGDQLVFSPRLRDLGVFDVTTSEQTTLTGHSRQIGGVATSPDGTRLASVDFGGNLIIWDTATWDEVAYYPNVSNGTFSLAFSPDGRLLAVGGADITLLDFVTGERVARLDGHRTSVRAFAFSQDGTMLVSSGQDGIVRLWAVP